MSTLIKVVIAWAMGLTCCFGKPPEYRNPVLAGDYPDPSVVRVGDDYWATATSSEWAPQFPILHSRDLVNWKIVGSAFPVRPKWAVGNFWAPEITYHDGRYYIYYVGRNQEGRLAVAVATSNTPQGPYEDHGQLIAQEAGSIDGMAFTDQDNQRWLVWKEDGNSRDRPTPIWLQRLSDNGLKLTGERREILRNDADWEGSVVEGPFILFRDGWYYLFYAGGACCGRECSYGVGVARARDLNGPWEKSPSNPILTDNSAWRCPGHGSVVQDPSGRSWFLYHAYAVDTFVPTGREMLLDEIRWDKAGWPRLGRDGPSTTAVAPVGIAKRGTRSVLHEHFDGDRLPPGWLWPQERIPGRELANGMLLLKSPESAGDDLLGAVVAKTCDSGQYRATTTVDLTQMNDATLAGIAAIGDLDNGLGLAVNRSKTVVWQRKRGRQKFRIEQTIDMPKQIHLRLSVKDGDQMNFAYSTDGKTWSPLGATFDGSYMPPWDRSIRIALTVGNTANATAKFDGFVIDSRE